MQKTLALLMALIMTASGIAFAAKYTVNTSGTIKNQSGTVITSPANSVNQNYYQGQAVQSPASNNYTQSPAASYPANTTTYSTNQILDNYFNNYQAGSYVASNQINAPSVGIIEFVMDYSGSMSNWIEVAKRSMVSILAQIPASTKVGFRVFGHNYNGKNPNISNTLKEVKKIVKQGNKFKVITEKGCLGTTRGACSATQQVAPITSVNINSLLAGMNSVNLGGATPLTYALDRAVYQDFASLDMTTPKKIVLITDGGENCGGDPCAFARKLMQKRSDVHIDVVLVSSDSKALACISNTTGGHFYNVDDLADFSTVINQSMISQPTIQPQTHTQQYEYIGE